MISTGIHLFQQKVYINDHFPTGKLTFGILDICHFENVTLSTFIISFSGCIRFFNILSWFHNQVIAARGRYSKFHQHFKRFPEEFLHFHLFYCSHEYNTIIYAHKVVTNQLLTLNIMISMTLSGLIYEVIKIIIDKFSMNTVILNYYKGRYVLFQSFFFWKINA